MRSIRKFSLAWLIFPVLLASSHDLRASIIWDETADGDLSSDPASPTPLNFGVGANTVLGALSEPNGDLRDYLTFTIGPNQALVSMFLDAASPDGVSFHAINSGNTGFIPGNDPSSNFLGLEFVYAFDGFIGMDLLPDLAAGSFGSTGFSIPLGPGTYTYLIQELTPGESRSYQITFNVVPEPSSVGMFGIAFGLSTLRRRRSN